jgi:hypothetical protein
MTTDRHPHDELEALARGELDREAAAAVTAHAAGCADCARELAWLRAELKLVAARRAEAPADRAALDRMWAAVERETGARTARPLARARWIGAGVVLAMAAAAVLYLERPAPRAQVTAEAPATPTPATQAPADDAIATAPATATDAAPTDAERAVSDAERAYAIALDALEADYGKRRSGLPPSVATAYDHRFRDARRELDGARREAGDDLDARVLILDLYASQVRSLRGSLRRLEARP